MKKYVAGLVSGIVIAFSISVYADDATTTVKNLIGLSVSGQFPVTVYGTKIDELAAVIVGEDGESRGYLPIRAVGDAFGVKINFDSDLGIQIEGSVTDSDYQEKVLKLEEDKQTLYKQIAELKQQRRQAGIDESNKELAEIERKGNLEVLAYYEERVTGLKDSLRTLTNKSGEPQILAEIEKAEKEIARLKEKLGRQ